MRDGRVMVRLIRGAGVLALTAACAVGWLCARQLYRATGSGPPVLLAGSAVQEFAQHSPPPAQAKERASPLIAQARSLEGYLNPPVPPKPPKPSAPKKNEVKSEPVPAIRPAQATPKFTVRATSYNETRPERSMVLIAEPGAEAARWVRQGERIGHFAIHEIRPGSVIYLAGAELQEMTLQRDVSPTVVASTGPDATPVPSSGPVAAAAMPDAPPLQPTGPSRRPSRRNRRTVGSARTIALD